MSTKCSRASARRFIKLFFVIKPTDYWFHQTLTFKGAVNDAQVAQVALKKLLDALEEAYPAMACFFVREHNQSLGTHFHVIFMFFGQQPMQPEQMRQEFGAAVFDRWNKIHDGTLARQANRMTLQRKDFGCISYLLKGIAPTGRALGRETHWHGVRNRELIAANSLPVSPKLIREHFLLLFPKPPKNQPKAQAAPKFTMQSLDFMKAYLETKGVHEWKDWKRLTAGRNMSDADFVDYLNSETNSRDKRPTL